MNLIMIWCEFVGIFEEHVTMVVRICNVWGSCSVYVDMRKFLQ
jgi:hypothetical protein